ncbi:SPOR domain-containing protein, partial [uncultured Clostridium sp.]
THRCVTGSFSDKKNADDRIKLLKSKGFDSFVLIA